MKDGFSALLTWISSFTYSLAPENFLIVYQLIDNILFNFVFSRRVPQGILSENLLDTEAPCSFSDCFFLDFLVWQDGIFTLLSIVLFILTGRRICLWHFIRQSKETEIFANVSCIKIMLMICELLNVSKRKVSLSSDLFALLNLIL